MGICCKEGICNTFRWILRTELGRVALKLREGHRLGATDTQVMNGQQLEMNLPQQN